MSQLKHPIAVSPLAPDTAIGLTEVAIDVNDFFVLEEVTVSSGTGIVWALQRGAQARMILETDVPLEEGMVISGSVGSKPVLQVVAQPDFVASGIATGDLGFLENRRELFRVDSVSDRSFTVGSELPTGFHRSVIHTSTTAELGIVLPETLDDRFLVSGKASLFQASEVTRSIRQRHVALSNQRSLPLFSQRSYPLVTGLERPTRLIRADYQTTSGTLTFTIFTNTGSSSQIFPSNPEGDQFHIATTSPKTIYGALDVDDLWLVLQDDAHENFAITLTLEEEESL